jgi:hypothetical protein
MQKISNWLRYYDDSVEATGNLDTHKRPCIRLCSSSIERLGPDKIIGQVGLYGGFVVIGRLDEEAYAENGLIEHRLTPLSAVTA